MANLFQLLLAQIHPRQGRPAGEPERAEGYKTHPKRESNNKVRETRVLETGESTQERERIQTEVEKEDFLLSQIDEFRETVSYTHLDVYKRQVKSSGNDEIALMSRSVERFIASMKQMIASMGDISGKLGTQADASDSVSRDCLLYTSGDPKASADQPHQQPSGRTENALSGRGKHRRDGSTEFLLPYRNP